MQLCAQRCAASLLTRTSRPLAALPAFAGSGRRLTTPRAAADVKIAPLPEVPPPGVEGMPAPTQKKDDVQGDMLKPSVVNTSWVRTLAMVGAVVAAASSTAVLPVRVAAFLHVTSYSLWLGANIWNTFFVGLTMFKHMPRQTFGRVQAQLFPKYFFLTTAANTVALGSLMLSSQNPLAVTGSVINLAVALAASLVNAAYIEPLASDLMFQRYDIENKENKTEEDKAQIQKLYKQFGKWHGISSLLNLITTCCALAHGYNLAGGITLATV